VNDQQRTGFKDYAERQHYFAVHGMQGAQLRDDEKQKEHA
jgi:hypothetical protein